jgi:hypothetical protein
MTNPAVADLVVIESPRRTFARLRREALDRFPAFARTLENFFASVERAMETCTNPAPTPASEDEMKAALARLEDYLEALLVGEEGRDSRPGSAQG